MGRRRSIVLSASIAWLAAMLASDGQAIFAALELDKKAVAAGEIWRLWTVTLLHDPGPMAPLSLHLLFNMYALYLSGPIVERLYGGVLTTAFYLVCALGGSLASFAFGDAQLGIGASGPQVVEGWYGMPFEKPLARTREYIGILRDIWARQGPVANDGPSYPLPLRDGPGVTGLGKPLKSSIHPLREDIPIFLAAEGPKNVAMAAELCDGWMAMLLSPHEQFYADALAEGFARPGARRTAGDFEVAAMVPFIVHADVDAAVDMVRPFYALYFGGMGAKGGKNFHANVAIRMGYEAQITAIQDLYLDGKKDQAAAAIPSDLIQKMSLLGPAEKIRHDLEAWNDSFVTTLMIAGDPPLLREAADIVLG